MIGILLIFIVIILGSSILYFLEEKDSYLTFVREIIVTNIFTFILAILIVRLVFSKSVFIINTNFGFLLYSALVCIISLILTTGIYFFKKRFVVVKEKNSEKNKWKKFLIWIVKALMFSFFIIGISISLAISWSIDFYGKLTPEQFLYNLNSSSNGTSYDVIKSILHTPFLIILCLSILFLMILFFKIPNVKRKKSSTSFKWGHIRTIVLALISVFVFLFGMSYSIQTDYLNATYEAFFKNSNYIEANYVSPKDVELKFPDKKRNLIHIYAESLESSYLSKELGGYMDQNLMPELTELAKENIHFSNNDLFGGWNQTYGSSWSIAGIVNIENGIPLKLTIDGNSYGKKGDFLPGITNLGDILANENYNQTVMLGSDASFAGRDTYFTTHGNYQIIDVKEARKRQLIPEDYNVWWGFEDNKLFDFAKDELSRLNNLEQPFNFKLITADTHFPGGYVSDDMEKKYDSQYANVIAHSDKQIARFIRWAQTQPFYENTTIVITGDHLSMDKTFFSDFKEDYKRTPYNLFINAPFDRDTVKTTYREFAPLDMFPTIVASLGVEIPNDRLGIGVNLFSDTQTLIEKDEMQKFNGELGKYSLFYDKHFLKKEKGDSDI